MTILPCRCFDCVGENLGPTLQGMYRPLLCGLSVLVMLGGCDSTEPAVRVTSSPAPVAATSTQATPGVRPSVSAFTVDGIGPYQVGADFNLLRAQGLLATVVLGSQVCGDDHRSAHGVPPYQDIWISAKGPKAEIYVVVNGSDLLGTPSGFKAGSDLGELKPAYGTAGEELNYKTKAGYLVKAPSGNGMLFDLDVSTKKVRDVIAGNAAYLKESFLFESDYC
jgi:hypothetical protein